MNLIKIFEFKGLYQAGKKMAIPLGYFRRFTNAYKDKTGRIKPFGRGIGGGNNAPTKGLWTSLGVINWGYPVFSAIFKGGVFQLISGDPGGGLKVGAFRYHRTGLGDMDISQVQNASIMSLDDSMTYLPAGNFSSAVVNGKLFFNEYVNKSEFSLSSEVNTQQNEVYNLLKFDGIQVSRAGLPTDWHAATPSGSPTNRIRTQYMSLGLDGELVLGNYLETSVAGASVNIETGRFSSGAVLLLDSVGASGVTYPPVRSPDDSLYVSGYYNTKFIIKTALASAFTPGTGVTVGYSYTSQYLTPGDWVMCIPGCPTPLSAAQQRAKVYDAYYMRVTNINGGSPSIITFDSKIKGFNGYTASWEDINLENGNPKGTSDMTDFLAHVDSSHFANIWKIVSYSNAGGTDPYLVSNILPVCWESHTTFTVSIAAKNFYRPLLGVLQSEQIDWFDVTVGKTTFPPLLGITQFSNLLVGYDKNALYFTDTSLGGSTEMVSGISNIIPYGSEYGDIVAVCGSENFLLISRERKNFIMLGELTTGNVSIVECDQAVPGAANARAVSNAFTNKIVFMNSTGIYAVDSSGGISDISSDIKDLFLGDPGDGNLFKKDVFKTRQQKLVDGYDRGIFKIALDEVRGFILFMTGKYDVNGIPQESNILVYDTNDGTWYEWDFTGCSSVEALYGVAYTLGFLYGTEDGYIRTSQVGQILALHWINGGEPSLEKQVNQVKLYGNFILRPATPGSLGGTIKSQNNYEKYVGGSLVTNTRYVPASEAQYEHKQRLDASKARVFSIIIEDTSDGGGGFTLEGIEIEALGIQEGLKK